MTTSLSSSGTAMSPEAKSTIKIVFFTLFLDLVGFSIIFPMFPALASYYLEIDPDNAVLQMIFSDSSADGRRRCR